MPFVRFCCIFRERRSSTSRRLVARVDADDVRGVAIIAALGLVLTLPACGGKTMVASDACGVPTTVSANSGVAAGTLLTGIHGLSVGSDSTCAWLADGTVRCWGVPSGSPNPAPVGGLTTVVAVSVGSVTACALLTDGTVDCWGKLEAAAIGGGSTLFNSPTPVPVAGLAAATAVSVGNRHICVLIADGTVDCWGDNSTGALGDGTNVSSATPVRVVGLDGVTAISAGGNHTCALLADGTVRCWGGNDEGQLGDGTQLNFSVPVAVAGLTGVAAVSAGSTRSSCALLESGTIACWGYNGSGELGTTRIIRSLAPLVVDGVSCATAISAPGISDCALLANATIRCWGRNGYGQLGHPVGKGIEAPLAPMAVMGVMGAVSVSSGGGHVCAVLADGTARCWGRNDEGQLGDGTYSEPDKWTATARPVISGN